MSVTAAAIVALAAMAAPSTSAATPLQVLVTIPPQAELVERIGGDRVEVHVVVPVGQDPHTFLPTPRQMFQLTRCKVYFRVGVPIEERLVDKLRHTARGLKVVDTTEGIDRLPIDGACRDTGHHDGHDHDHGGDHNHPGSHDAHGAHDNHDSAHGAGDPHVWLAPTPLTVQAGHVVGALTELDPAGADDYRDNHRQLVAELKRLDGSIAKQLAPYRGRAFYVFHPALGYFADAYGLEQKAVEVSGRTPTPRELRQLIADAKRDKATALFVQPQFDQRSAQAVARAAGLELVVVDPLRRDVMANLRYIADELMKAFGETTS